MHLSLTHRHILFFFFLTIQPPPNSTLFPYTTLFRSAVALSAGAVGESYRGGRLGEQAFVLDGLGVKNQVDASTGPRSEEHTSELQSPMYLVCRLLLEKKKNV